MGALGFEGLIGIPIILGTDRTPHKTFMQVGGPARRIPIEPLWNAMEKSGTLRKFSTSMCKCSYSRGVRPLTQMPDIRSRSGLRGGCSSPLTGWAPYNSDLRVPVFHAGCQTVKCYRRHACFRRGTAIKATRGAIEIRDRVGLEARAGGCYGVPEREYDRLIGPWR
jgi:hypothetical protein